MQGQVVYSNQKRAPVPFKLFSTCQLELNLLRRQDVCDGGKTGERSVARHSHGISFCSCLRPRYCNENVVGVLSHPSSPFNPLFGGRLDRWYERPSDGGGVTPGETGVGRMSSSLCQISTSLAVWYRSDHGIQSASTRSQILTKRHLEGCFGVIDVRREALADTFKTRYGSFRSSYKEFQQEQSDGASGFLFSSSNNNNSSSASSSV